jgi:UDP-N-acetylglucosamine 2-epimerase (non-hydrolysing)
MHILHVVGARPNFMKAAPVLAAFSKYSGVRQTLVHTGQHYDANMSDVFFQQLGMPVPDVNLEVPPGSHAQQTAQVLARFEPVVLERTPDLTLVYGDVNSTMAATLVCAKLQIRVGHVEAGLRSRDRGMPEEINRLIADQLADLLFTPSIDGDENLCREGIAAHKIHRVGNVMIDTLVRLVPGCAAHKPKDLPSRYALVTLHRPSNVDDPAGLKSLLHALEEIAQEIPVVFPIHPRTRKRMEDLEFSPTCGMHLLDPAPYLAFLSLQKDAAIVITDSGGVQEETTFLGVPCLTLRESTERPITVTMGTNLVIGRDLAKMQREVRRVLQGKKKTASAIPLWDGHAAKRIAQAVLSAHS